MIIDYANKIEENVVRLRNKESQIKRASILKRVQVLRLLKSGKASSMSVVCELVGLSNWQDTRLWKRY